MKYALYLDFTARAGEHELGQHTLWLPGKPEGRTTPLASFPLLVEAWKIRVRGPLGIKIALTLTFGGTISLFQVG